MVDPNRITLRDYVPGDTEDLIELFRTTVRTVNSADYNLNQLEAWAPDAIDLTNWRERQSKNVTVVALIEGQIAGFGELCPGGIIHMLYVGAFYQNQGVAHFLLHRLEERARLAGMSSLKTYASLTANGFFVKYGYRVLGPNKVTLGDQVLDNILMEKHLPTDIQAAD